MHTCVQREAHTVHQQYCVCAWVGVGEYCQVYIGPMMYNHVKDFL